MTGYGKALSSIRVIDENQVDVSVPFACSVGTLPMRIIFRIPPVPIDYRQVTTFPNWLEARRAELMTYSDSQNQRYAEYAIQFEVQEGSRHDILRALREKTASQPLYGQTSWLKALRNLMVSCMSCLRIRRLGLRNYTVEKRSA